MGKIKGIPKVGESYVLGRTDCFAITLRYLEENGYKPPKEFLGVTRDSYPALFKSDKEKALSLMEKFLCDNLQEIPTWKAAPGDILLVDKFLGIEVGNAKFVTSCTEMGVIVENKQDYTIRRAFRWEGT